MRGNQNDEEKKVVKSKNAASLGEKAAVAEEVASSSNCNRINITEKSRY